MREMKRTQLPAHKSIARIKRPERPLLLHPENLVSVRPRELAIGSSGKYTKAATPVLILITSPLAESRLRKLVKEEYRNRGRPAGRGAPYISTPAGRSFYRYSRGGLGG